MHSDIGHEILTWFKREALLSQWQPGVWRLGQIPCHHRTVAGHCGHLDMYRLWVHLWPEQPNPISTECSLTHRSLHAAHSPPSLGGNLSLWMGQHLQKQSYPGNVASDTSTFLFLLLHRQADLSMGKNTPTPASEICTVFRLADTECLHGHRLWL